MIANETFFSGTLVHVSIYLLRIVLFPLQKTDVVSLHVKAPGLNFKLSIKQYLFTFNFDINIDL